ncbi:MAG: hypothetical protein ACLQGU_11845 [bacterium]
MTEEQKGVQKAAEEFAKGDFYKEAILTYYLKKEYKKPLFILGRDLGFKVTSSNSSSARLA